MGDTAPDVPFRVPPPFADQPPHCTPVGHSVSRSRSQQFRIFPVVGPLSSIGAPCWSGKALQQHCASVSSRPTRSDIHRFCSTLSAWSCSVEFSPASSVSLGLSLSGVRTAHRVVPALPQAPSFIRCGDCGLSFDPTHASQLMLFYARRVMCRLQEYCINERGYRVVQLWQELPVLAPLYTDFESGRHCTVCCMPRAFRMLPVAGQGGDTPLSSQSPAHIVR